MHFADNTYWCIYILYVYEMCSTSLFKKIKCPYWPSVLVLSCAASDVNIRFPFLLYFCPPGTNWGQQHWIVPPFILSSFIHPMFSYPESTDETLMNLWRMTIRLSSAGSTWHLELKTRWSICFRLGRVCLISPPPCLTHTDWLFAVPAEPSGHIGLYTEWKKKNPIRAGRDIMQDDEQVLQPYCTFTRSGNVNIFKAERSCHPVTEGALRIHSHHHNSHGSPHL